MEYAVFVIYLDTSALLRLVLNEPEADIVERYLNNASYIVSSRLLIIEAERSLRRLHYWSLIPRFERILHQHSPPCDIIEMSPELCELARHIAPRSPLRTLDAIHLATFSHTRSYYHEIEMFTFDQRLREVTRETYGPDSLLL